MNYKLTTAKSNILIFCSILLIFNHINMGFQFLFEGIWKPDMTKTIILDILFLVSDVYIFLVFINYFKFYRLNALKSITIVLLIFQIGAELTNTNNFIYLATPELINISFNLIIAICTIVLIVLTLKVSNVNYVALGWLRRYAYGYIVAIVISVVTAIFAMNSDLVEYDGLINLPFAIPYFFIIGFAKELKRSN